MIAKDPLPECLEKDSQKFEKFMTELIEPEIEQQKSIPIEE